MHFFWNPEHMTLQPAVKKETAFVAIGTSAGTALMLAAFFLLHRLFPDSIPFDYRVIISAVIGCAAAAANFFLMAVTVQKIAELGASKGASRVVETERTEDGETVKDSEVIVDPAVSDKSRQLMKASYRNRTLMQLVWAVLAFALPVFNGAAGLIPLFIPSILIKLRGIAGKS